MSDTPGTSKSDASVSTSKQAERMQKLRQLHCRRVRSSFEFI